MLKNSDVHSVTVRTVPVHASGRVQEVDIVGSHGDRRVHITVADLAFDEMTTAWVSMDDARILHAHLGRLIKRADRNRRTTNA